MRISRSTGVFSGLLVLILGIWAGLIPFVGPYFHYSFGSNATWHYTANRFWLDILPAAAVVLGSLVLLRSANRVSGVVGSWLAIAGGAWLAVGPAVSRVWEHGAGPIGQPMYGSTRQMLELVGYFYGVGVLIAALSAFALGRFVTRPGVVLAEPEAAYAAQTEPATQPERVTEFDPVDEPVTAGDRRHTMRDRRQTGTRSSRTTSRPTEIVSGADGGFEDDGYVTQPGSGQDSSARKPAARN